MLGPGTCAASLRWGRSSRGTWRHEGAGRATGRSFRGGNATARHAARPGDGLRALRGRGRSSAGPPHARAPRRAGPSCRARRVRRGRRPGGAFRRSSLLPQFMYPPCAATGGSQWDCHRCQFSGCTLCRSGQGAHLRLSAGRKCCGSRRVPALGGGRSVATPGLERPEWIAAAQPSVRRSQFATARFQR